MNKKILFLAFIASILIGVLALVVSAGPPLTPFTACGITGCNAVAVTSTTGLTSVAGTAPGVSFTGGTFTWTALCGSGSGVPCFNSTSLNFTICNATGNGTCDIACGFNRTVKLLSQVLNQSNYTNVTNVQIVPKQNYIIAQADRIDGKDSIVSIEVTQSSGAVGNVAEITFLTTNFLSKITDIKVIKKDETTINRVVIGKQIGAGETLTAIALENTIGDTSMTDEVDSAGAIATFAGSSEDTVTLATTNDENDQITIVIDTENPAMDDVVTLNLDSSGDNLVIYTAGYSLLPTVPAGFVSADAPPTTGTQRSSLVYTNVKGEEAGEGYTAGIGFFNAVDIGGVTHLGVYRFYSDNAGLGSMGSPGTLYQTVSGSSMFAAGSAVINEGMGSDDVSVPIVYTNPDATLSPGVAIYKGVADDNTATISSARKFSNYVSTSTTPVFAQLNDNKGYDVVFKDSSNVFNDAITDSNWNVLKQYKIGLANEIGEITTGFRANPTIWVASLAPGAALYPGTRVVVTLGSNIVSAYDIGNETVTSGAVLAVNNNGGHAGDYVYYVLGGVPSNQSVNNSIMLDFMNTSLQLCAVNPNGTVRFTTDKQVRIQTLHPNINILNFQLTWQNFSGVFDTSGGTCVGCRYDLSNGTCQAEVEKVWGMFQKYRLDIELTTATALDFQNITLYCRDANQTILAHPNCSGLFPYNYNNTGCVQWQATAGRSWLSTGPNGASGLGIDLNGTTSINITMGNITPFDGCEQIACEIYGEWVPGNTQNFVMNKTITVTAY